MKYNCQNDMIPYGTSMDFNVSFFTLIPTFTLCPPDLKPRRSGFEWRIILDGSHATEEHESAASVVLDIHEL